MRPIAGRQKGTVLILLGDESRSNGRNGRSFLQTHHPERPSPAAVLRAQWYCRVAEDHGRSALLIAPGSWEADKEAFRSISIAAPLIWHDEYAPLTLPETYGSDDVWIVDGSRWAPLDWSRMRGRKRRRDRDVLVFGSPEPPAGDHYSESLLTDESGRVLSFTRHYTDSPTSADLWHGFASLLVCRNTLARAVVAHLLAHGWGLDSIGGLTRRFRIGWDRLPAGWASTGTPDFGRIERGTPGRIDDHPASMHEPAIIPLERGGPDNGNRRRNGNRNGNGKRNGSRNGNGRSNGKGRGSIGAVFGVPVIGIAGSPDESVPARVEESKTRDKSLQASSSHLFHGEGRDDRWYRFAKRSFDIVVSGLALVVLAIPLLIVGALVRLTSKGPAMFGHTRQGLGGAEFSCLKFRTMIQDAEAMQAELQVDNEVDGPQFKIDSDPRLTRLGFWLRRYNVDELPQLINVLRGEMSLVGPRPSPDGENQCCPEWRKARLSVRPGITGLWQVMRLRKRSASDFQEWIYYDVEYARHRSMWLDLQLLIYTPLSMFGSQRLGGFAERLKRRGICPHADQLRLETPDDSEDKSKPPVEVKGSTGSWGKSPPLPESCGK